jgi:hypothetical protein
MSYLSNRPQKICVFSFTAYAEYPYGVLLKRVVIVKVRYLFDTIAELGEDWT